MAYYCESLYYERTTIVISPVSQTKNAGSADPELDYNLFCRNNVDGLLEGALSRESGESEGEYKILQGSLNCTDGDYTIVFKTGRTLTIQKASFPVILVIVLSVVVIAGLAVLIVIKRKRKRI